MKPRLAAAFPVAALLLLSGCFPAAPRRVEAFASAHPTNKRLSVGVVETENARNLADYLKKWDSPLYGSGYRIQKTYFADETKRALEREFKSVVPLSAAVDAAAAAVDLVATVDLYAKLGMFSHQETVAEVAVEFRKPDGTWLATLHGRGTSRVGFPNTGPHLQDAIADALNEFSLALSTDDAIGTYSAKPGPGSSPIAAAERSYNSDVETPSFSNPENPMKFAVVVGVESYESLPAAEHAVRDARAVKAHLLALGYPERNIVMLTDQRAGRSALESYIETWLPQSVDENSTVFFFFSGHGAPDVVKGQAYLMPWDGNAKFLNTTGYPVARLYKKLNALKAKHVLVALDACFSGLGGRSVIAQGVRPLVTRVDTGDDVVGRASAIAAAASDEATGAEETAGHGLLTYYLLRSLDARGGRATLRQLYDDLKPKVQDAARRDNRDQTPQLVGDGAQAL